MATAPRVPATARDLDATPDDGRIYEILDGQMEVQPRPRPGHNFAASSLNTDLFAPFEAVEIDVGALFVPLPAPPAAETP